MLDLLSISHSSIIYYLLFYLLFSVDLYASLLSLYSAMMSLLLKRAFSYQILFFSSVNSLYFITSNSLSKFSILLISFHHCCSCFLKHFNHNYFGIFVCLHFFFYHLGLLILFLSSSCYLSRGSASSSLLVILLCAGHCVQKN